MRPQEIRSRHSYFAAWFLTLGVMLGACAPTRSVIPVVGARVELAQLVGTWSGEYNSAHGSSGTISFVLAAGTDSARGEVIMLEDRNARGYAPMPYPESVEDHVAHRQVLKIMVIRLQGVQISGELASYVDPVSGCTMTTTFEGAVQGDYMHGTFTSRFVGSLETRIGSWHVTRQEPAPDET